jgi:hypothetical protein
MKGDHEQEQRIILLLPMKGSSLCSGCGKGMDWYETPAGRRMPMNAGAKMIQPETWDGGMTAGLFYASDSHWVTCPERGRFKGKR